MRKISTKFPGKITKFVYNSPSNFVVCWNGVTFGMADGCLFNSANFPTKQDELNWLKAELLFIEGVKERIEMYQRCVKEIE